MGAEKTQPSGNVIGSSKARCQSGISARPAALKQVTVSLPCRPSGAGKVILEDPPRSIGFAVRIDVQHDQRDLAPVGTFAAASTMRMSPAEMELAKYRDIERERSAPALPLGLSRPEKQPPGGRGAIRWQEQ
jgi:hypothetical protein